MVRGPDRARNARRLATLRTAKQRGVAGRGACRLHARLRLAGAGAKDAKRGGAGGAPRLGRVASAGGGWILAGWQMAMDYSRGGRSGGLHLRSAPDVLGLLRMRCACA